MGFCTPGRTEIDSKKKNSCHLTCHGVTGPSNCSSVVSTEPRPKGLNIEGAYPYWRDQYRSILTIITKFKKHSPSHLSMPKSRNIVKAADVLRRKSKAKAIEWEPRVYSRGIRDVPVEVISTAHQPRSREKGTRRPSAENDNTLQGEAAPHPMDVDETFWVEEPVMPTSEKRVRQPAYPFLANLTYLPVPAHLHSRIYPQDCTLPRLPPQVRRCSGGD